LKILSLVLEVTARTTVAFAPVKASARIDAFGEVLVTSKAFLRFDPPSRRVAGNALGESGQV